MTYKYRLIGLTGTNCAGKGEAAVFLKGRGYDFFSLSDEIRMELAAKGLAPTRVNLISEGNRLREAFGPDVLARRVMTRVAGRAVIDSIRNPQEIKFLRRQKGFVLLAVDAPVEIRFERAMKRGRAESASTLDEFIAKEQEEMRNDPNGQQLQECARLADLRVANDGTIEEFHRKLEGLL